MNEIKSLYTRDYDRPIETVIKADDRENVFQEVDEYVITKELIKRLSDFFEAYNDYQGANGVWITGFFGSGKSHLLKILSYVLENKSHNGIDLSKLFADKVINDAKLKADILKSTRTYKSESILFNIDQHAQITSKTDTNAILQVFYKVFYDHQGFYGFQPHIAEFESYLFKDGKYDVFKTEFKDIFGKDWVNARVDYVDPIINDAVAEACGRVYYQDAEKYVDYLDEWEDKQKFSIEDFALKVKGYVDSKGANFRLNFYVDEVGQFIAENTKLMLNLQTIAESLATKCEGKSWVIVTSQEDLESLIGDDSSIQSDDFSKIQGRFKVRMPLTSANVGEVIEKRLLEKNNEGAKFLNLVYKEESENLKTLLTFSETGMQFKGYQNEGDFTSKYPFIPYQFDLFQQCIKELSKHNAFQGKHQSVGERSMLGVFQEVLKTPQLKINKPLVSFNLMFDGLKASLRSEVQNSIILAENQLSHNDLAIRTLKVLFLIKYYGNFKATARNISVLLIDSYKVDLAKHSKNVEVALNVLEQQSYVNRNGDIYEYLTDTEKDIEQEIKDMNIDDSQVSNLINEIIFDGIIKDHKLRYNSNKQDFEFTRKVDGNMFGREKELTLEIVSPNSNNYNHDAYFKGNTMGNRSLLMIKLPENKRLIYEVRMSIKTDKYIKQSQSSSNKETVARVLYEKGKQNSERKRLLENTLNVLLGKAEYYLNGIVHNASNSTDGRTKVIENAQDLISLAYPKLQLLGSATYDENQLSLILNKNQGDLFNNDNENISLAEKEVLNFIIRNKDNNDRTSLTALKDMFNKSPYGYTMHATWCLVALLYRRGKVESTKDHQLLDDKQMKDAFNNNRQWANTLISPQIDYKRQDIERVKTVYRDAFNETNPHSEAKDVALLFIEKAKIESEKIKQLLNQADRYPFLSSLKTLYEIYQKLGSMSYANLIVELNKYENDLLDAKEDNFDPIQQFMNGEQRKIYDRILMFQNTNKANYEYINQDDREVLSNVQESQTPYAGNQIKTAKEVMDKISSKLLETIAEEKELTISEANKWKTKLSKQSNFFETQKHEQEKLLSVFDNIIAKAKQEKFISNFKTDRYKLNELYIQQLNKLAGIINEKNIDIKANGDTKPKVQFISMKNVEKHLNIDITEIENTEDIINYLDELRKVMQEQIDQNRKITLS